jgi:hypothetical protein
VWDLGGLIGSTTWGLWVAALGATVLLRPIRAPIADAGIDIPAAGKPTPLAMTGHGS